MPGGEQEPATPEDQVRFEVAVDRTLRAVAGMFGIDYASQAGGAAATGKWVFTSLDQLDDLIKRWTDVRDAIDDRRKRIRRAQNLVYPPADDVMSGLQADTLKASLEAMWRHADSMCTYAEAYVQKLQSTRSAYANTESGNTSRLKNTSKD